jgi:hypothetical protein
MPLPVITTPMAHHPLWSTITHITYLYTHYLSHVAPHLEMCPPNNEVLQILQNGGNYTLSDKAAHPKDLYLCMVVTFITISKTEL